VDHNPQRFHCGETTLSTAGRESAAVFEIGSSLREARTRRGLSPADVHKAIRIRERYLTALEEERWELLPGDAYGRGFLRTYADFLGLHGQLYVDEYNARVVPHDEDPPLPEPAHQHGILVRAVAAVLVVGAVLGALVAWRQSASPSRPQVGAAAAAGPKVVHHTKRRAAKPAVAPQPTFALVRATRDRSWLLVRIGGPNGRPVFTGILEQGQSMKLGLAHGLWLRMGRPQALDITVGGRLVRDLPASPANLSLTR
jgi:cytoskeleton protein RodZ